MRHVYHPRTRHHNEKSPAIAAILGLFFGAFGLLYVRWYIGLAWIFPFMIIWSQVNLVAGLAVGLLVALIVSSLVGYFAAKGMNSQAQSLAMWR